MSEKSSNVIFIGNKPPMSYVLAIISAFGAYDKTEITLKARGQAIATAVDVAEIIRNRYIKDLKVSNVIINTAEMPAWEGQTRSRLVSTMEITLTKVKGVSAERKYHGPLLFRKNVYREKALDNIMKSTKAIETPPRSGISKEAPSAQQKSPERIVNTGFSSIDAPATPIDKRLPLAPQRDYYFWFEVGPLLKGTIEVKPEPLNGDFLRTGAKLTVAMFSFEGEIRLTPNKEIGEIKIEKDGTIKVSRQVSIPNRLSNKTLLKNRLFFPVQTSKEGMSRLRCNIYYKQILVESRLITVQVSSKQEQLQTLALESKKEYSISKSLNPNNFGHMKPQVLSIMLNDNENGTHSFRMLGNGGYKESISFRAGSLKSHIDKAREDLREASWGSKQPCTCQQYHYSGGYDEERLTKDLALFARDGYRFWLGLAPRIAPKMANIKLNPVTELQEITLKHGIIEFAIKDPNEAADYAFPIAMIYDYFLDTSIEIEKFTLCKEFLQSLKFDTPLEKTKCFNGDCPSRGQGTVICPSGFWGFRHSIGMPLGVGAPEINPEILFKGSPEVDCAAFQVFESWNDHQKNILALKPNINWQIKFKHYETIDLLKSTKPHLVYFYCEGGAVDEIPYIQVGDRNERIITPDNFAPLYWFNPMPLVFINGCRTAALDPKLMMNFVSDFIVLFHASGVIGTEIQVFEQLAAIFAEDFLRCFLVEGETVSDSIRMTRLALLKRGNPLGLVYTAYANASLRLKQDTNL
jgi:DNA-binding protein Alba